MTLTASFILLDLIRNRQMRKKLRHKSARVLLRLAQKPLHNQPRRFLSPDLQYQLSKRRILRSVSPGELYTSQTRPHLISERRDIVKDRVAEIRVVEKVVQDVEFGQVQC